MRRLPPRLISVVLLVLVTAMSAPAVGRTAVAEPAAQLPNLVPWTRVPSEVMPGGQLRFDTFIRNRSAWSFEVMGVPNEPMTALDAKQCVAWADPPVTGGARVCANYENIGELVWHREHNHLHLDGLATYRLFRDEQGEAGELIHESPKVGFCLMDSYPLNRYTSPVHVHPFVDPLLDDRYDLHKSQTEQWYVECRFLYGSGVPWPGMRMGISAGWQDLYNTPVPGQSFDLTGQPDGTYWIQTLVNASPVVTVRETDLTDNTHWTQACVVTDADGTRRVRPGAC